MLGILLYNRSLRGNAQNEWKLTEIETVKHNRQISANKLSTINRLNKYSTFHGLTVHARIHVDAVIEVSQFS